MGTDIGSHLASPYGQPMASIYALRLGKQGTLAIWSFMFVIQFGMGMSITLSCSRQMWAFSRDNALPMSRYLKRITKNAVPVYAVWSAALCSCVLGSISPSSLMMQCLMVGLLALINTASAQAVFAIAVLGTYTAYVFSTLRVNLTSGNSYFCSINVGRGNFQAGTILSRSFLQTSFLRRHPLHDLHDHHALFRKRPSCFG